MAWASRIDVERWFTYQAPTAEGVDRIKAVRDKAKELAVVILDNTPGSADQSAALRKLREVVMVASAAVALERPVSRP